MHPFRKSARTLPSSCRLPLFRRYRPLHDQIGENSQYTHVLGPRFALAFASGGLVGHSRKISFPRAFYTLAPDLLKRLELLRTAGHSGSRKLYYRQRLIQ
jgi:hypothetical protein